MYRESDFTKEAYKTGEVAKILGVTPRTIQLYDKDGKLRFERTPKGRRVMTRRDLLEYLDSMGLLVRDDRKKRDVIYARVSSQKQEKSGDLDRQALYIIENVSDLMNPLVLKEVGSGLNDRRKQLHVLLRMVMSDEVNKVYVTYKDRLTRFGFNYIQSVCNAKGVEIVVVKDLLKEKSVQEELVDDMMSLIASFSGKLYGLRSKGNSVKGKDSGNG